MCPLKKSKLVLWPLKRFEMLTPEEQLRTVSERAGFVRRVSKRMYYKTGEDVDDGFGNLIASCREYPSSRTNPDSEAKLWMYTYAEIGLVLDVKVICHHNVHGTEIQICSTSGDKTKVWVVISRSSNRYVDELRHRESQNLPEEVAQEWVQDQDEEYSQGERSDDRIPIHKRVWEVVSKKVRHENSRERETDGAIHWKIKSSKLRIRFQRDRGRYFTDRGWINFIWKGSNKTRFQHCQNSCNNLLYLRAIQRHTRGEMVCVTPLNPRSTEEEEDCCRDLTTPSKILFKTDWMHSQNAVYWIHLGRTQQKGKALWQTKAHAPITNSTVPLDCIERVISQRGEMTFYQRSSTPRPAPRIVPKSAWNEQQQQQQQQVVFKEPWEAAGGTQSEAPSLNNTWKEERSFQIDLRVQGVSQDDIYKDEERKPRCKIWLIRYKTDTATSQQEGVSNVFSKESKRKLKEMDNIELHELSETIRTTQCPIYAWNIPKKGQFTADAVSVWYSLKNTQIKIKEESIYLQSLCTWSSEEDSLDLKSGNTIMGKPKML